MRLDNCRGFSLSEIVVATAVTVVVMTLVAGIMAATNDYWTSGNIRLNITEDAQQGVLRMVSDLRLTDPTVVAISSSDPLQPLLNDILDFNAPAAVHPVTGAPGDLLTIPQGDVQVDGTTGKVLFPTTTSYRFRLIPGPNGQQLVRQRLNPGGVPIQTTVLANRVQTLQFTGLTAGGAVTLASPNQLAITLVTQQLSPRPGPPGAPITTDANVLVQLRNEPYRASFSTGAIYTANASLNHLKDAWYPASKLPILPNN